MKRMLFTCLNCGKQYPLTEKSFPFHCICGAVFKPGQKMELRRSPSQANVRMRSDKELDELIATYCVNCDHYSVAEVCEADPSCRKCKDHGKWRMKAMKASYTCPQGRWVPVVVDPIDGRASLENTTICITTFKRPKSLERLLESLNKHYPQMKIEVEDTKGNLSAGRNRLVSRCRTPFVMIMEDDFQATEHSNFQAFFDVLNADNEVGLVCGGLMQNGKLSLHDKDIRLFRGILEAWKPPACGWMKAENGTRYRYVDMAANFFVARREVLVGLRWDEDLELMEHGPWFWELKKRARWRVAVTDDARMNHFRDRPTQEYKSSRNRVAQFAPITYARYGFRRVTEHLYGQDFGQLIETNNFSRPNIVVFGVGHQGSRLFVQMLEKLGWQLGNVKPGVMESRVIQRINKTILKERGICECGELGRRAKGGLVCPRCNATFTRKTDSRMHRPLDALFSLEQPWAIKDPRMVLTISDKRWREAFDRARPIMLFFQRDIAEVRKTYKKHKWKGEIYGHKIEELRQIAREEYNRWPYAKLRIDYEQLIEAAKCVDFERT